MRDRLIEAMQRAGIAVHDAAERVSRFAKENPWIDGNSGMDWLESISAAVDRYSILEKWLSQQGLSVHDLAVAGPEHEEFLAAYDKVLRVIAKYGSNSAVGQGDFFLVDERCNAPEILLEVRNAAAVKDPALQELKSLLAKELPGWRVVVRFFDARGACSRNLIVSSQGIEE
jgi:hypothetical protein